MATKFRKYRGLCSRVKDLAALAFTTEAERTIQVRAQLYAGIPTHLKRKIITRTNDTLGQLVERISVAIAVDESCPNQGAYATQFHAIQPAPTESDPNLLRLLSAIQADHKRHEKITKNATDKIENLHQVIANARQGPPQPQPIQQNHQNCAAPPNAPAANNEQKPFVYGGAPPRRGGISTKPVASAETILATKATTDSTTATDNVAVVSIDVPKTLVEAIMVGYFVTLIRLKRTTSTTLRQFVERVAKLAIRWWPVTLGRKCRHGVANKSPCRCRTKLMHPQQKTNLPTTGQPT